MNKSQNRGFLSDVLLEGRVHLSMAIILLSIAIRFPKAKSYEISLFTAYPYWFWAGLLLCVFLSVLGGLSQRADQNLSEYALGCIFMSVLSIPLLRGYYLYGRGDVMTHIGSLRWIINNSRVDTAFGNFYPGVHTFGAVLAFISDLSPNTVTFLSAIIFSIVYVIGLVSLGRRYSTGKNFIGLLAVIPFLGTDHLFFIPHSSAILFIPIVIFVYMKASSSNEWEYYLLFTVLSTSLVFLHPTATLLLVLSCTVITLIKILCAKSYKSSHSKEIQAFKRTTISSIITFIIAFSWYFSFPRTGRVVVSKFLSIFLPQNSGGTRLDTYSSIISETSPSLLDLLKLGVYNYGDLMLLSGVALLVIVYRLVAGINGGSEETSLFYAGSTLYVGFLGLFLSAFVVNYFLGPTGASRYLTLSSILVIAFGLPNLNGWMKSVFSGIQIRSVISIMITLMFIFSIVNLYPSPMVAEPNHQISEAEWEGSGWFFEYDKEESKIRGFKFSPYRFYTAHYGRNNPPHMTNVNYQPQEKLGYGEADKFSTSHPNTDYFVYSKISTIVYRNLFPNYEQHWTYPPKSFKKLQTDPSVNRVYDNGGFWVNNISHT